MPILVVDARSCDRTREFAIAAGAEVIERDWDDFVSARRFALSKVRTPWMLALDADEALDDRLRDAVISVDGAASGYVVRRDTYYCGKPLRMWSGERLLRLMRASDARVDARPAAGGAAQLHERYACDGSVAELPGTLLHFSYDDAADYRAKYDRYTDIESAALPRSIVACAWESLRALVRFPWLLLARGALLDGARGISVAWWSAWYSAIVRWKALVRR